TKMEHFGVTPQEVQSALSSALSIYAMGSVEKGDQRIIVELETPGLELDKLNEIPIRINLSGRKVMLKDLAEVQIGGSKTYRRGSFLNGKPAAELVLFKDKSS